MRVSTVAMRQKLAASIHNYRRLAKFFSTCICKLKLLSQVLATVKAVAVSSESFVASFVALHSKVSYLLAKRVRKKLLPKAAAIVNSTS